MSNHATLSPSSSSMWLDCTPSALLNAQAGESASAYALEGTSAHILAEHKINKALNRQTDDQSATNRYLWQYEVISYSDGTSTETAPCIIGTYSSDGRGVKSVTEYYAVNNSTTAPADSEFTTAVKTTTTVNKYLWNYEVTDLTDGSKISSKKHIISIHGATGNGIKNVAITYAVSTSNTTAPTSGWQTSAPAWVSGKYIWHRTVTKYSTGSTDTSKPVCITGEKGATGATGAKGATGATGAKDDAGIGVKTITEQYYLSNSKAAQSGGSWVTTAPAYKKDYYYWTRSKIEWTDGTTTYTTAVLASGVNSANEKVANMEVGGRNLVLLSDFSKATSGGIVTVSGDEIIFDSTALGSTVTPYTLSLGISAFAKTNIRNKQIVISMDYKVDRAIAFGTTNPWVGAQLTLTRNDSKGGSTQNLNLFGGQTIPTAKTSKWVRAVAVVKASDYDASACGIKFWFRDATGKLRIRHPKVEIGNVATDWTPASEDAKTYMDAQIVITKSDIKKTTDSISLEVSKKVGANEIISKINQTAETVTNKADKINFNGMITANKTFKIDTSGYMQATGGKVGGWKITSNSLENTESTTYVKLNSGSFTSGTWSESNIFAIGTKQSDGTVKIRWAVNQYGNMVTESCKTGTLTVNSTAIFKGTTQFDGSVALQSGAQVSYNDNNSLSIQASKLTVKHGGKSYSLLNFVKGVMNKTIT